MLKEDVEDLKGSLKAMSQKIKEQSLALEMMTELKKTSKRWFTISVILLIALILSNASWLIYESQFEIVAEESTQYMEDIKNSNSTNFTQHIN